MSEGLVKRQKKEEQVELELEEEVEVVTVVILLLILGNRLFNAWSARLGLNCEGTICGGLV